MELTLKEKIKIMELAVQVELSGSYTSNSAGIMAINLYKSMLKVIKEGSDKCCSG